jgi:hypothetical protein
MSSDRLPWMGFLGKLMGRRGPLEDRTEAILRKYLDGEFRVSPMAEGNARAEQVDEVGRRYGVSYPTDFTAHVCGRFPGMYVEVKESVWPRPKENDVGPLWSFLYALHTYTPVPTSEPWMRLADAAESFQKQTGLHAAPVLKRVGDRDLYFVDSQGALVRFRHEESTLEPVKLNFWELLDLEVRELAERKARKKDGR